jgi:hypothetical protein
MQRRIAIGTLAALLLQPAHAQAPKYRWATMRVGTCTDCVAIQRGDGGDDLPIITEFSRAMRAARFEGSRLVMNDEMTAALGGLVRRGQMPAVRINPILDRGRKRDDEHLRLGRARATALRNALIEQGWPADRVRLVERSGAAK